MLKRNLTVVIFLKSIVLCAICIIVGLISAGVTSASQNILVSENFNNLSNWISWGSPSPAIVSNVHGYANVFDNRGDGWCNSGIISKQHFDLSSTVTIIEAKIYLQVDNFSGCWVGASIAISDGQENTTGNCANDGYSSYGIGVNMVGDACWATPKDKRRHSYLGGSFGIGANYTIPIDDKTNKWVTLKMEIDGSGFIRAYIDNHLYKISSEPIPDEYLRSAYILVHGRSSGYGGKAYLDNLVIKNNESSPINIGDYNYYLPGFTSSQNSWTGLALSNANNNQPSSVNVVVYGPSGNQLSETRKSLAPSGKTSFLVASDVASLGWMYVNSEQPLSGLAFFAHNPLMTDIPFVSELENNLVIPHIAQDNNWDTIIMMCNPKKNSSNVRIINVNEQGGMVAQKNITLPPKGSGSYPLNDLFGAPLSGKIYLQASSGIAAFALYSNTKSGGNYYSGINAIAENYNIKYVDVDADGDGYSSDIDCNDNDATINPGATEICGDGIDQDCNGSDLTCQADPRDTDDDHDGYTENQGDCNDDNANISPGVREVCGDGIDNNCNGKIDEECTISYKASDFVGTWKGVQTVQSGREFCSWNRTVTLKHDLTFTAVSKIKQDSSPTINCIGGSGRGNWKLDGNTIILETTWSSVGMVTSGNGVVKIIDLNHVSENETEIRYGEEINISGEFYRQ